MNELFTIGDDHVSFTAPEVVLPLGYQAIAHRFFRHTIPSAYEVEMAIATIEDVLQATSALRQVAQQASCADPYLKEIARITGSHDMLTQPQIEDVFNRVADVISGSPKRDGEFPDETGFISYLVIMRELSHHLNIQQIILV
ncbi:hypothetical protein LHK94_01665 [Dickeya zeae]|uniref:Uncharacterized protein n=1 Tax=Dickeya zeae (strain Ech586) TaxID=590409 RepID=D2C2J8_DICZ5|nr:MULTISPECIES: hypothetical protein [Dickeya]ACZ77362.1 conserved hypothetical protein [Dickeya parazeae Ech586]UCZ75755.1 hypothetical protein LHK94_01665 [Dickeya zeae]